MSTDGDRIEKVGLIDDGKSVNAYNYLLTTSEANQLIAGDNTCFFVNEKGDRVEVSEFGDRFIKTDPDGVKHNNLRELPHCGA